MSLPLLSLLVLLAGTAAPGSAPLDTMVDVGGHRLHFIVHRGTEPLTVVMEAGGGASVDAWSGFEAALAARTGATIVAYERAGFGKSDLGPADLSPTQQVRDLGRALETLATPRRRIIVAHSYGALMALLHTRTFPDDVVGLVLVDPMNPRFVEATGDFLSSTVPQIESPSNDAERAVARMVRTFAGLVDEVRPVEARSMVPMVVITAGEGWWGREDVERAWRASHEAMAGAAPHRRLVVASGSDHDIPEQRPDVLLDAVLALVRSSVYPYAADVATPDAVIAASYDALRRAPGEPFQWDRFESLFAPSAPLIPNIEQTGGEFRVMTVGEFRKWVDDFYAEHAPIGGPDDQGFAEEEIHRVTHRYGDVVQVMSTYQKRFWDSDEILGRGINAMTLVHNDGRWWIAAIAWDEENGAGPVPEMYLPGEDGAPTPDVPPFATTIDVIECRPGLERECLHFYEQNWRVTRHEG